MTHSFLQSFQRLVFLQSVVFVRMLQRRVPLVLLSTHTPPPPHTHICIYKYHLIYIRICKYTGRILLHTSIIPSVTNRLTITTLVREPFRFLSSILPTPVFNMKLLLTRQASERVQVELFVKKSIFLINIQHRLRKHKSLYLKKTEKGRCNDCSSSCKDSRCQVIKNLQPKKISLVVFLFFSKTRRTLQS